jgi:hypothetical protein
MVPERQHARTQLPAACLALTLHERANNQE